MNICIIYTSNTKFAKLQESIYELIISAGINAIEDTQRNEPIGFKTCVKFESECAKWLLLQATLQAVLREYRKEGAVCTRLI
ncbi:MAG: hypothetical protein ACP5IH_05675 [Desulfurella sp.]|uniref:Uncharacterized protein n=1 Tax=Desulfurella multipotens TaxID=79269 RepID=A0A1G6LDQ3_9BACT|nr:hypothetical protein [Desulfurella multipotens]SDC40905.1 hypothetical protein SAMN05660835_00777 [Desulfurella multipotens]